MKEYAQIEDWFRDQLQKVEDEWDAMHLVTGEEGVGKSVWIRKCARKVDKGFDVSRIHFNQSDFLDQAVELPPGSAIVLDEFRGHRRLAMHGDRMEFLDFAKECRGLRLHIWIGFPHVNQFEKDLLTNRLRYWEHIPKRGYTEIRARQSTLKFKQDGEPFMDTKWPLVGRFQWDVGSDPLRDAYLRKKDERMRDRRARYLEAHGKAPAPEKAVARQIDAKALERALARLRPSP